jgi:hypothetical protein
MKRSWLMDLLVKGGLEQFPLKHVPAKERVNLLEMLSDSTNDAVLPLP